MPLEYPLGVAKDPRVPLQIEQAPRTVNYAELPWDAIVAILKAAERGNTERFADLTRRMLTDGHLAANVETRKLAIATAKLAIEPADPDDEIDVRGAADAQRMWDGLPGSRIKKDAADGIFVGWACLQIQWEARGTYLWPKDVLWNHPRRFRFGWDFKPYIYDDGRALVDQSKLSEEERARCRSLNVQGMPLDPHRWIVHMPRAFPDYPQMGGVFLQAVRAWWIKANALRYQLAGAEIAGNGRVHGEQDPNADATTKDAFLTNLANWGATGVLVTTPGAKVNFTAPLAQGASSVWSTLIDEMNGEESKAVLGSTLATDNTGTGSRALGETQKSATIDPRAEVDDDEIRHTLHRDLIDVFLESNAINYGRKPNVRTRSVWVDEDATIDETILKYGVVTKNQLLASRGLPPLETGGEEFAVAEGGGFGAFAAPMAAGGELSDDPPPPAAIKPGDVWTDSHDGHRIKINAVDASGVLVCDLDAENPGAQFPWAAATLRGRCTPPASGGTPAASPLPASDGDALSDEAHGDLWALAEGDRKAALIAVGHPGMLTAQAMLGGVEAFDGIRASLINAARSEATFAERLAKFAARDTPALTEQIANISLQARMAGMLFVAQFEAPEAFEKQRALDDRPVPPFLALPFDEAVAAFERRRLVSPEEFEAMGESARSEAFTATRLAHEALVERARVLLARTLREGGTFADFREALRTDEAALGVTPSSPWYLETVYRTNVQMAYGAGRLQLLTSPAVAATRPYLERRTARDDRVRETHAALEGALFPQSDADLCAAYAPPYLDGELQFNCRCVYVARRAEDVDASKVFTG